MRPGIPIPNQHVEPLRSSAVRGTHADLGDLDSVTSSGGGGYKHVAGGASWRAGGAVQPADYELGYTDAVMNHRRAFLRTVAGAGAAAAAGQAAPQSTESDRQY